MRLLSRNRLPQHFPTIAEAIASLPVSDVDPRRRSAPGTASSAAITCSTSCGSTDATSRRCRSTRAARCCASCRFEPPLQRVGSRSTIRSRGSAPAAKAGRASIAKRRDSRYEHRRSPHWLKMKCEASQELVVGGFTDPQGARVGLGALLVGYFEADDFVFAGKVGTGFDTKLLLDLRGRLDALEIPASPFTQSHRAAAAARALGASGDRRAGRVHRVDGARQAAPSAACSASASTNAARDVVRETP